MLIMPKEFADLMRTILTPGKRTITGILRVMGLVHAKAFQHNHRLLNRNV
jgi:hypothetical protein